MYAEAKGEHAPQNPAAAGANPCASPSPAGKGDGRGKGRKPRKPHGNAVERPSPAAAGETPRPGAGALLSAPQRANGATGAL